MLSDIARATCIYNLETIEGYCDDLLPVALSKKIADHIAKCEICQARVQRIRERAIGKNKKPFKNHVAKYTLYFDGNKNLSGISYSYRILDSDNKTILENTIISKESLTVPSLEYMGLEAGIARLMTKSLAIHDSSENIDLMIYGDSQLVVNQVNGTWECKSQHLRVLRGQVRTLLTRFNKWKLEWIPRDKNLAG